jgi:ribonuclease HII
VRGLWRTERELRGKGFLRVAGVDEAGRGPIAGPVVAAAAVFADGCRLEGLADSKVLRSAERERLFEVIRRKALCIGVGSADARTVDRVNIVGATHLAMREAIGRLQPQPDFLVVDGRRLPGVSIPQMAVVRGDKTCACVAAASIVAKVTRDRMMVELDQRYPGYGFARHKGYGTAEHLARLVELGPCPEHRRCFRPVRAAQHDRLHFEDGR